MEKGKIISIIVGVLVLGLVIFLVSWTKKPPGSLQGPATGSGGTEVQPGTSAPAPIGVKVPEPNSSAPLNVAKPNLVAPASPGSSSNLRLFNLEIKGDKFTPDTIIVNKGDIVSLTITAVDKNYDFTQPDFGFKKSISKGQTQEIGFQASAVGKFTFFCSACGGPDKGPVGYIIIVAK